MMIMMFWLRYDGDDDRITTWCWWWPNHDMMLMMVGSRYDDDDIRLSGSRYNGDDDRITIWRDRDHEMMVIIMNRLWWSGKSNDGIGFTIWWWWDVMTMMVVWVVSMMFNDVMMMVMWIWYYGDGIIYVITDLYESGNHFRLFAIILTSQTTPPGWGPRRPEMVWLMESGTGFRTV